MAFMGRLISSIGQRPASYCHGVVSVVHPSVHSSVCLSVHKLFLQKTSPQKLLTGFLQEVVLFGIPSNNCVLLRILVAMAIKVKNL